MSRLNDIREKLKYVEHQRQALMDTLYEAKKEKKPKIYSAYSSRYIEFIKGMLRLLCI